MSALTGGALRCFALILAAALWVAGTGGVSPVSVPVAWAADDDDDGGRSRAQTINDDDDDDDGRPVRRTRRPPTRAPNEIVALEIDQAAVDQLLAEGFSIIADNRIGPNRRRIVRLRIPRRRSLGASRRRVRQLAPGAIVDFNHYYRTRTEQGATQAAALGSGTNRCDGPHCAARNLIAWPHGTVCTVGNAIGLIDTGINRDHAALKRARIEMLDLGLPASSARASDKVHGTAVASLLVGAPDSRSPGLVPNARLVAVDVFYRDRRGDQRTEVVVLVAAMETLAAAGVRIINMSLSGPPNQLIFETVERLAGKGVTMLAAAGNDGARAKPVYPAAYDKVIAVTAVDSASNIYRRAVQGPHIDFAAPGVDVWAAASVRGARPKTGTSFAVPFVSALAALALDGRDTGMVGDVRNTLRASARDLGAAGRDPVYGEGLIQADGLCR